MARMESQISCQHPLAALRDAAVQIEGDTITLRAACGNCAAPITKQFLTRTPDPAGGRYPAVSEMTLLTT